MLSSLFFQGKKMCTYGFKKTKEINERNGAKWKKEAKLGHSSSLLKKIARTIPSHSHFYAVWQRKGKMCSI